MKKILLSIIAVITAVPVFAQWTTSGNNTILSNTGNVGIGTTSPNAKLDVDGNVLIHGTGTFAYSNPGAAEFHLGYSIAAPGTVGSVSRLAIQPYGHTGGPWKFAARDDQQKAYLDIYYGDATGSGFTINNLGYVGIGALSPDAKLTVKGTIHTQEVRVDMNGWPDYVFKNSYQLPSLAAIETYIVKEHHLPDVPSEETVKKNGIELGEMVKLQTKKIEELTLYLIEQNKQLKAQKQQITRQQQQLINQQHQIKQLSKMLK